MKLLGHRAALLLLLLAAVALTGACSDGAASIEEIDFAFLDTETVAGPELLATGDNYVWFVSGRRVVAVDVRTRQLGTPIEVPDFVKGIATEGDDVWVVMSGAKVVRVDHSSSEAGEIIELGDDLEFGTDVMAVGGGFVWVSAYDRILRFDAQSGDALPEIAMPELETLLAGDGVVWAAADGHLVRIESATGEVTGDVVLSEDADMLSLDGGVVWAASSKLLHKVDAATMTPVGEPVAFDAGLDEDGLRSLVVGGGSLWGVLGFENEVVRRDPETGEVMKRYSLKSPYSSQGAELGNIRVSAGAVWVGTRIGNRVGVIVPE